MLAAAGILEPGTLAALLVYENAWAVPSASNASMPWSRSSKPTVKCLGLRPVGSIHFAILPGSVAKSRHLLDRTVA